MTTNAERLVELFGSQTRLANIVGVDKTVIMRWTLPDGKPRSTGGRVPTAYNHVIREAAKANGIDLAAVQACLDPECCPACGHRLEPGQRLDMKKLKALAK